MAARILAVFVFLVFTVSPTFGAEPQMLKERMQAWETQMIAFQAAMYRHDFVQMKGAMKVIENTGAMPGRLSAAVQKGLDEREFTDYMKLDQYIRETAGTVVEQADNGDIQKVLVQQGRVVMACVQCHDGFKAKVSQAARKAAAR